MAQILEVPSDSPDEVVRRGVESLRRHFLSLLRGESTTFNAFLDAYSKFDAYVHTHEETLSDDTMQLIQDFLGPLSALSTHMFELHTRKASALEQLPAEIESILSSKAADLTIEEQNASHRPSYIESCARWLKQNCHNPYPSSQVRSEIVRQTHAPRKDIDAWFIDARKRIGWNDLRRKHFDNKRAKILQAASLFFNMELVPSESDVLDPDIEGEFAAILGRATALYDQKFAQSKLADKLDVAVRDMTPTLRAQLKNEKARQREEERGPRTHSKRARHVYPTPDRSPPSVAELLASPPSPIIDLTIRGNSPTLGSKRRRSLQSGDESASPLPCKRPRSQSIRGELSPEKGLPSPATSTQEELLEFSAAPSPKPLSLSQFTPTDTSRSTGKRKRCLSDGFQYPAAKRPQRRPQAVSDPFPTASGEDWDQWFREHVLSSPELTLTGDIPPPVTVDAPDSNTPLDIQLFNFPLIPDLPPSAPAASAPAAELNVIEPLEVSAVAQVNVEPEVTALDQTFSWMANDFPTLLPPTNTFPSSTDIYVHSTPFSTLDVISQPFPHTQSPAFLHDPSLWSNISNADLDFSALFNQPLTGIAMTVPIRVPSQPTLSASKTLSEQEREAKRKELEELEARAQAIRAEISAP